MKLLDISFNEYYHPEVKKFDFSKMEVTCQEKLCGKKYVIGSDPNMNGYLASAFCYPKNREDIVEERTGFLRWGPTKITLKKNKVKILIGTCPNCRTETILRNFGIIENGTESYLFHGGAGS